MSVRYALMGLLREQSDYGYHLKQRFDDRVGNAWRLNLGQVYQTLKSLEREGLIEQIADDEEPLCDDPAASRREYRLTEKGGRFLERWLRRRPGKPRPLRDELLIRLLVLEPERQAEALERIDAQVGLYQRHLARLQTRKRRIGAVEAGAPLVAVLGLEAEIAHANAHLEWLEYCRLKMEAGAATALPDRKQEAGGRSRGASAGSRTDDSTEETG